MKKVIGLNGKSNCGKSRTLYLLGKSLIERGYEITRSEDSLSKYFFSDSPQKQQGPGCDFRAIFSLGNKTVGVTSWGDNKEEMKKNLDFIEDGIECDFVVSASRTSGETKKQLQDIRDGYDAEWFWIKQKYVDHSDYESREQRNQKMVEKLLALIE